MKRARSEARSEARTQGEIEYICAIQLKQPNNSRETLIPNFLSLWKAFCVH